MASYNPHETLDKGFALRAEIRDVIVDWDDPAAVSAYTRKVVADDPEGAAAAIFAMVVEASADDETSLNVSWLFEEWKRAKRDELERRRRGD